MLNEFIKTFISPNSMVRLITKEEDGYLPRIGSWDMVSMQWEILKDIGIYKGFGNRKVLGVVSISQHDTLNSSAINIIIESDNQFRDRMIGGIID